MINAFQLGDLVLAKFDEYPYWPAVVEKCFWRDPLHYGRWRLVDTAGNTTKLWCSFVEDDSANWVPLEKVKTFTPKAARRWQCRRRTRNYEAQQKAIEAAEKLYATRMANHRTDAAHMADLASSSVSGTTGTRSASPSSVGSCDGSRSLGELLCSDTSGNILMSDCKDSPVARKVETGSKRSREEVAGRSSKVVKREQPLVQVSMTKKAPVGAGGDHVDVAAERHDAQVQAGKPDKNTVPKKIRIKEEWIQAYKQSQTFAEITIPHSPADLSVPLAYQSKQMQSDEFVSIMQHLRRTYSSFKNNLEASSVLREQLHARIAENQKMLEQFHVEIGAQECDAGKDQIEMAKLLERLVEADIALDDLRKHRAGKLITSVMKNCGEIPHIKSLCSKIVELWREQCRIYDEQAASGK